MSAHLLAEGALGSECGAGRGSVLSRHVLDPSLLNRNI